MKLLKTTQGKLMLMMVVGSREKMIEAAIFRSATVGKIEAQKIAPWIPPACRSATVLNSEIHKGNDLCKQQYTKTI